MLESLYNRVVDAFVEGLADMREDEATPFHIDLAFKEDPETGDMDPEAVNTKVVFLDPEGTYSPLYFNIPKSSTGKLDKG